MTLAVAFDPRPDELLYSAIARHADAMRYPGQRAVLSAAFGHGTGVAVADLPGRLEALVRELVPGHRWTASQLAREHTMFPYYAWSVPHERAARVFQTMCAADGRTLHERLGIRASTVSTPSHLQYCSSCVAADRAAYGSAHWRRAHQAPGVYLCFAHDEPLRLSGARRNGPAARLAYQSLERWATANDRTILPTGMAAVWGAHATDRLRAIARDTAWLLTCMAPAAGSLDPSPALPTAGLACLWAICRKHLTDAGFVRSSGRARLLELRNALLAHYGRTFLDAVGCTLHTSRTGEDWLARFVRRPRSAPHPLQVLLVLHVLDTSAADTHAALDAHDSRQRGLLSSACAALSAATTNGTSTTTGPGRQPNRTAGRARLTASACAWDRRLHTLVRDPSISLREIGRRLGITPKTVQRHARRIGVWRSAWSTWARSGPGTARRSRAAVTRRRHRDAWRRLRRKHPTWSATDLRRARRDTFSYLYRYDRAWLTDQSPAAARRRAPSARVDWAARDASLRAQAEQIVRNMLDSHARPVRLCLTTVARRLGHPHLLAARRDRLPVTTAYLNTIVETRSAFAIRRVWWVAEQFAQAGQVPARWALVRAAGLRPELESALYAPVDHALEALRIAVGAAGAHWIAGQWGESSGYRPSQRKSIGRQLQVFRRAG